MDIRIGAPILGGNIQIRNEDNKDKLRKACQEVESFFIAYLLESMRKTIPRSDFMNGGLREEIYLSKMDEEVARYVAEGQGIGLAAALYQQLSQGKNI